MADILFKTDDYIFSYRVGGVLIHIPNKNIYPPQAKEYIMNLPDEIVYFVYKE